MLSPEPRRLCAGGPALLGAGGRDERADDVIGAGQRVFLAAKVKVHGAAADRAAAGKPDDPALREAVHPIERADADPRYRFGAHDKFAIREAREDRVARAAARSADVAAVRPCRPA